MDSLVEPELTVMVEPGENPFCSSLPARKSPDLDSTSFLPTFISVFFDNFSNDDIKKVELTKSIQLMSAQNIL